MLIMISKYFFPKSVGGRQPRAPHLQAQVHPAWDETFTSVYPMKNLLAQTDGDINMIKTWVKLTEE